MKKVLLCTMPISSITVKKPFVTQTLGTLEIAGGLDEAKYDVTYLNLNAYLNTVRTYQLLTENELDILSNVKKISSLLNDPDETNYVYTMAKQVADKIKEYEYDVLAFSLARLMPSTQDAINNLHFALMVSCLVDVPVHIGGVTILRYFTTEQLKQIIEELKAPVVTLAYNRLKSIFPNYLNAKKDDELQIIDDNYYDDHPECIPFGNDLDIPLYMNVDNHCDLVVRFDDIFPERFMEKYPMLRNQTSDGIFPFKFSKGCMFKCAYCPHPGVLKNVPQNKSVDVIERYVNDYGITDFTFFNTNINFSRKYLLDFCNDIVRRNIKIQFSDSANLFLADEEIFSALADAGCIFLWYGVETLSPRIQKQVHKKLNYDTMVDRLTMAHNNGIWNCINLIHSFPHESDEEFQQMISFLEKENNIVDSISAPTFLLFPKTEFYTHPERFGITIRNHEIENDNYEFDEIGGLSWEERNERAKVRMDAVYDVKLHGKYPANRNNKFFSNHTLVFQLYRVFKDKQLVREALYDLIDIVEEYNVSSEYSRMLYPMADSVKSDNVVKRIREMLGK